MNCTEVTELLSAYFDGELPDVRRAGVAAHLEQCPDCQQMLLGFEKLSQIAGALTDPTPPDRLWDRIETQLNQIDEPPQIAARRSGPDRKRIAISRWWLALAALVLAAVTTGWFIFQSPSSHEEHSQFVADFAEYLDRFRHDPDAAQNLLLAKYEHQQLAPEEAIGRVGYRPVVAGGLPSALTIASTHVVKMPCCTCVQCLCRRSDGTALAIFEHNDDEPEWFGERPTIEVQCQSKQCSLVELPNSIAATWQLGKRHITVIGARDLLEVNELVAWFDQQPEAGLE